MLDCLEFSISRPTTVLRLSTGGPVFAKTDSYDWCRVQGSSVIMPVALRVAEQNEALHVTMLP